MLVVIVFLFGFRKLKCGEVKVRQEPGCNLLSEEVKVKIPIYTNTNTVLYMKKKKSNVKNAKCYSHTVAL